LVVEPCGGDDAVQLRAFYQRDSAIFAYAFTWVPYIRSLVIHRRRDSSDLHGLRASCPPLEFAACGAACPGSQFGFAAEGADFPVR
jgi:hypothetical protein